MRIDNTYIRNQNLTRQRASTKSQGGFGQMLSSQSSTVRNRDSLTFSTQRATPEPAVSRPATKRLEAGDPELHGASPSIYYESFVSEETRSKLIELAEMNEKADYTGMSYDEIFSEIWDRYNEAFDGNIIAISASIAGPAEWSTIGNQFRGEIFDNVPRREYAERKAAEGVEVVGRRYDKAANDVLQRAILKKLGYYGMSDDEIETAINEKYAGKNTVKDFLDKQSELQISRVLKNKMGIDGWSSYTSMIRYQFELDFNPQSAFLIGHEKGNFYGMTTDQWSRVFAQPFDTAGFASKMREMLKHMSFEGYPMNIKDIIESAIDEFIDGSGSKDKAGQR